MPSENFTRHQSASLGKAKDIQLFTPKKKYGAIAFESGIYVLGLLEFVLREGFLSLKSETAPATQAGTGLGFGKYKGGNLRDFLDAL